MTSPVALGFWKALPQTMRTKAFGDISGTYSLIGTVFNVPLPFLYIVSSLDVNVTISLDGTNDFAIIVPNVPLQLLPLTLALPGYIGVYVKGSPSSGAINVSALTYER